MRDKIERKIKKRNKLERRVMLYFSVFLLLFATILAVSLVVSSERSILNTGKNNIRFVGKKLSRNFEILFNDLYLTGFNLNRSIKTRVVEESDNPKVSYPNYSKPRKKGEPVRIDNGESGAYLSASSKLDDKINSYIFFTQRVFKVISHIARSHFFNFYFISKDNFIRITPKDWALELEPDHDFSKDIFYDVAAPEKNPGRFPSWTPIYYDSIWKKWMTSLVIPIYKKDEFIGVTGSDIFLEDIFRYVIDSYDDKVLYQTVIFDDKGNLIAHKDFMEQIYQSSGEMNTLLNIENLNNPILQRIISTILDKPGFEGEVLSIDAAGETCYYTSHEIPLIGWNVAIYSTKGDLLKDSHGATLKILAIVFMGGLIILIVIRYYLKKLFLKRITNLGVALQRVSSGNMTTRISMWSNDEIGILEQGFIKMLRSLNSKFRELEYAKEEIQQSKQRYETYIENAPYGIFITDEKGKYLMVNKQSSVITGYSEDELLTMSVPDLLTESSLSQGLDHFRRAGEFGSSKGELEYKTKYGNIATWSVDAVKLTENSFIGFVMDITERKENEKELMNYRANLEQMVKDRTAELLEKNEKLEHFNQLFVGREFRIKELKEKLRKYEGEDELPARE